MEKTPTSPRSIGPNLNGERPLAQKSFRCKLVTPTAALVDDPVVYASVPASDGLMGFLPGRAPILARLGTGELKLDFADTDKGAGGSRVFVVSGGIVRMEADKMTILAEQAIAAENISPSTAEGDLRTAKTPAETEFAKAKLKAARTGGGI